mmetsp:Transcript_15959/g.38358  ORF Transcript_15959/g.38358 Transcript_15959/m.38358 type:complete len:173 (+) Transcript_15959:325-843(+)
MPGQVMPQESSWAHDHRWKPVNSLKNSRVCIQILCSWTGKRFNIPETPIQSTGNLVNYFDEAPEDHVLGSTTLQELVKRVKKNIPGLYLWDEVGGAVLNCGPREVFQSEWDTTMVCDLICEERAKSANGDTPRVVLKDGREAVVVTIGTAEHIMNKKPPVVQRCLAKGDVYG